MGRRHRGKKGGRQPQQLFVDKIEIDVRENEQPIYRVAFENGEEPGTMKMTGKLPFY